MSVVTQYVFQWKSFHVTVWKIRQKQFGFQTLCFYCLFSSRVMAVKGLKTHITAGLATRWQSPVLDRRKKEKEQTQHPVLFHSFWPRSVTEEWNLLDSLSESRLPTSICSAPSLELFKSGLHSLLLVPTFPWTARSCNDVCYNNYGFNVRSSTTAGSQQTCHLGGKNGSCPSIDPQSVWYSAGRWKL